MRARSLPVVLLLFAQAAFAESVPDDGPTITVRTELIPIEARSVNVLLRTLQADERVRAHALTRSLLSLRMDFLPEALGSRSEADSSGFERCPTLSQRGPQTPPDCRPQACRLSAFEVRLEVDLLLPEWQPLRVTTADEDALWQDIRARLQTHEQRHREHAESSARRLHARLRERLDRIEPVDCLRLRSDLEGLRQAEVQNLRLRDRVFDQGSGDALHLQRRLR